MINFHFLLNMSCNHSYSVKSEKLSFLLSQREIIILTIPGGIDRLGSEPKNLGITELDFNYKKHYFFLTSCFIRFKNFFLLYFLFHLLQTISFFLTSCFIRFQQWPCHVFFFVALASLFLKLYKNM